MLITANAVIRNYVTLIALKYKYELINFKNFKLFSFLEPSADKLEYYY
jgi:hypothetical protein